MLVRILTSVTVPVADEARLTNRRVRTKLRMPRTRNTAPTADSKKGMSNHRNSMPTTSSRGLNHPPTLTLEDYHPQPSNPSQGCDQKGRRTRTNTDAPPMISLSYQSAMFLRATIFSGVTRTSSSLGTAFRRP